MTAKGRLFLMPTPLDLGCDTPMPLAWALPPQAVEVAAQLNHWICENAKSTRAFLKRVDALQPLSQPIAAQHLVELPRQAHKSGDHLQATPVDHLLQPALEGHDMGLISEAGMPAVADPGSSVVRAAHRLGIAARPLVGPSALLLALAASGMNGQQFAFWGYLPIEAGARRKTVQQLEQQARQNGQAQLFIEVPHRNAALLTALLETLNPATQLCLAVDLGLPTEQIRSLPVSEWRRQPTPPGKHQPTVFIVGIWPRA